MACVVAVSLLLTLNTCYVGSSAANKHNVVYVSKVHGSPTSGCGSIHFPCKSLQLGFDVLAPGGHLYLEGTNMDPYNCESSQRKLIVKKGFTMNSYLKPAYISCTGGMLIESNSGKVTLKNVLFKTTKIILDIATAVIKNCVFINAVTSIQVKVSQSVPLLTLNISNSFFEENHNCLDIDVNNVRCSKIHLQDVTFRENYQLAEDESTAFIKIWGKTKYSGEHHSISMNNVTVSKNRGLVQHMMNHRSEHAGKMKFRSRYVKNLNTESSFLATNVNHVNIELLNIRSKDNTNMRFLNVLSPYCFIKIDNCRFQGHSINNSGAVIDIKSCKKGVVANVSVNNSVFINNTAGISGGILYIDGGINKNVYLSLINTIMKYSYGNVTGCAIGVGDVKNHRPLFPVGRLYVVFDGLSFKHCNAPCKKPNDCKKIRFGNLCFTSRESAKIIVKNSLFSNNYNKYEPTLVFKDLNTGKSQRQIEFLFQNTKFVSNASPNKASIVHVEGSMSKHQESRFNIVNSTFAKNLGPAIKVGKIERIYVKNLTCVHNKGICLSVRIDKAKKSHFFNANVLIQNSVFKNNTGAPLTISHTRPNNCTIVIQKTSFRGNIISKKQAIRITIGHKRSFRAGNNCTLMSGNVTVEDVDFIGNIADHSSGSVFGIGVFPHQGKFTAVIRNTSFKDNFQYHVDDNPNVSDLMYLYMPPSTYNRSSTKKRGCVKNYFPKFIYLNQVTLENVLFTNNTGFSNIMFIDNGKTIFRHCLFENNFSRNPRIGMVIFTEQGRPSITFENTIFHQTKIRTFPYEQTNNTNHKAVNIMPFIYFAGLGPFVVRNSRFVMSASEVTTPIFIIQNARYVHFDENTTFACPVGSYIKLDNSSHVIPPEYTKSKCPLNITRLKFTCRRCPDSEYSLEKGTLSGTKLTRKWVRCFKCPYGGDCTFNIRSRKSFWGYINNSQSPPQIKFEYCPEKYCDSPTASNPAMYNHCRGNRAGVMCGACKKGFTESIFNHKCRPNNECTDNWFWVIAGLYSIVMALYILYQPPIVLFLVKKLLWFREQERVVPNSRVEQQRQMHGDSEHGYFKIIFYFYQIADLLMLESCEEILHNDYFIGILLSFYNFQVKLMNDSFGCPFPGLTVVTKELFGSLQVFAVMAWIVFFYFLSCLLHSLTKRQTPPVAPYIAATIEVLLLGYERLGHTSLELLHCTPLKIEGHTEWRLFLDGNITCWVHWWQFALVAYNIIFVIPFLFVLFVGTSKLRRHEIRPVTFILACSVPMPFLVYWAVKKACKTERNHIACPTSRTTLYLLEVLQGPFRSSSRRSKGALHWESVLIGRRLVMLCLRSLIAKPMLRLMAMTVVCITILIHEVIVLPFKERTANNFSIISLFILVTIGVINLSKASLIAAGIHPYGFLQQLVDALQTFEVALLGIFPSLLGMLVVGVVISQAVRLGLAIRLKVYQRKLSRISSTDDEQRRPLLVN